MKKNKTNKRLLRELLDLLLCVAIAALLALSINSRIRQVVNRTVDDLRHTEWVKAARQVASEVTLGGDGNNK